MDIHRSLTVAAPFRQSQLRSGGRGSVLPVAAPFRSQPRGRPGHFPAPWHFLYFLPLPQGQGSLRPTFRRGSPVLAVFVEVPWQVEL